MSVWGLQGFNLYTRFKFIKVESQITIIGERVEIIGDIEWSYLKGKQITIIQPPLKSSELLPTQYLRVVTPLRLGEYSEAELKMVELLLKIEKPKTSYGNDLAMKSLLIGAGIALFFKLVFILLFAFLK